MKSALLGITLALSAAPLACLAEDIQFEGHTVEIDTVKGPRVITKMTSTAYQTTGTARDIILRSQTCIAQHLSNSKAGDVTGGEVIEISQPENGFIAANNRVNYRQLILPMSVESKFVIEAKDGRFRVVQSNLQALTNGEGVNRDTKYSKIFQHKLTGWEKALLAALDAEKKVVDCINSSSNSDAW